MKKTLFNYALIIASAFCLAGCEEYEQVQSKKETRNERYARS